MIYKKYTQARLAKTSQVNSLKVKINQDIFKLYGSGAKQSNKSLIMPYLIMFGVLILFLFLYFTFFRSPPAVEDKKSFQTSETKKVSVPVLNKNKIDTENKKLINVYCDSENCFYKDFQISQKFIYILDDINSKVLFKKRLNLEITKYTILLDTSFYSLLDIREKSFILGVKDAKNSDNTNFYNIK